MPTFGDLQLNKDLNGEENDDEEDEDEEYIPGKDEDCSEASSCSEESLSDEEPPEGDSQAKSKSRSKVTKSCRRKPRPGDLAAVVGGAGRARRGGIRLDGEEPVNDSTSSAAAAIPESPASSSSAPLKRTADDAETYSPAEKRREDTLWASFLSDVGGPRPPASIAKAEQPAPKPSATKIFDFAGESVAVPVPAAAPSTSAKRPSQGGVQSLLDRLTKRPKISTLEKSRLDWETFKSTEGIGEDLAAHNRGRAGYLERQAFLERADYRQFERERDARLASQRQGQGSQRKP